MFSLFVLQSLLCIQHMKKKNERASVTIQIYTLSYQYSNKLYRVLLVVVCAQTTENISYIFFCTFTFCCLFTCVSTVFFCFFLFLFHIFHVTLLAIVTYSEQMHSCDPVMWLPVSFSLFLLYSLSSLLFAWKQKVSVHMLQAKRIRIVRFHVYSVLYSCYCFYCVFCRRKKKRCFDYKI